ncbi:MAG: DUF3604 domain-containing protein [Eubacteriales bacterium]
MRLDAKHLGTSTFSPTREVCAGEISTWTFTFTAGEYGIDDGGTLLLCWKNVSDWGGPQFNDPKGANYCTVTTDGQCKVRGQYAKYIRSYGNSICIDVFGGYLQKGDTITLTLGDRSGGSIGMFAQSFCEREHELRVCLDPCGTFRYEQMPEVHLVRVRASWPHEIQAIVPGSIPVGTRFDVLVRALDEYGNPTHRYTGTVAISSPQIALENLPATVTFTEADDGAVRITGVVAKESGIYHLALEDIKAGFTANSNAGMVTQDAPYQLFWGDAHGQTRATVGTGLLDDYYAFARDKGGVDFTGWQGNDFEVTDETWSEVRSLTKKYHQDGKFVVFLGYEWSGTTPQGGDHNVYFKDDSEIFYPSSNWTATTVSNEHNCNPVTELYDVVKQRGDMMVIPHIGGRYGNLEYYDPEVMKVIEIHSHHGTFEWFAMDAMKKRLKVGFIATSDDHTCRPGLSYPLSRNGRSFAGAFDVASGFSGVYATDLSREAIWDAIQARRCYASSFDRVYLDMKVDGHWMGEEYTASAGTPPKLTLKAGGVCAIETITLFDWDKEITKVNLLPKKETEIRVRWSGVVYRGRGKSADWHGMLYVEDGCIRSAKTYAFDRLDQGIDVSTDHFVSWRSSTSGDFDGLVLRVEGDDQTGLRFHSEQGDVTVTLGEIRKQACVFPMGGLNLEVEFDLAPDLEACEDLAHAQTEFTYDLPSTAGEHAYWARITQSNGNSAWASPVFVTLT